MRDVILRLAAAIALLLPGSVLAGEPSIQPSYPVLKVTAYPGETITPDMVEVVLSGHRSQAGAIAPDKESVVGKMALRTLVAGQPIPRNALREPYAVRQGKMVPLIFQSGNITITGVAVALESGSVGEMISARNPDSGISVRGIVLADGSLWAR
jgi:flagellar basal body P-ring formation protein FlgA